MDERTSLWLPPLALSGCLRAVMLRDTRGRGLSGSALSNYFPASPLVALYLFTHGDGDWLETPGFSTPSADPAVGPVRLAGPFTQPTHTRAHGDVAVFKMLWMADAFSELTGIDAASITNRVLNPLHLLDTDWQDWLNQLLAAPDDTTRLAAVQSFLLPRWHHKRPTRHYTEWTEALALRAATSGAGRSLRQMERRIRAWAGLPLRELRAMSRAEAAFLRRAAQDEEPWSSVALDAGYSDQSHLCRETRRLTGFSPEVLSRRIESDESVWVYRLWR
jgi:AraC-like DNA-binding protein